MILSVRFACTAERHLRHDWPSAYLRKGRAELACRRLGCSKAAGHDAIDRSSPRESCDGIYVVVAGVILFLGISRRQLGMRVSPEEEREGLDCGEHGNEAYHGFVMVAEAGGLIRLRAVGCVAMSVNPICVMVSRMDVRGPPREPGNTPN